MPDISVSYGEAGYQPVAGDWDRSGRSDAIGVFVDGWWFLRNSNSSGWPDAGFAYGAPGYRPVVGDWDGDGPTDVGVLVG